MALRIAIADCTIDVDRVKPFVVSNALGGVLYARVRNGAAILCATNLVEVGRDTHLVFTRVSSRIRAHS